MASMISKDKCGGETAEREYEDRRQKSRANKELGIISALQMSHVAPQWQRSLPNRSVNSLLNFPRDFATALGTSRPLVCER